MLLVNPYRPLAHPLLVSMASSVCEQFVDVSAHLAEVGPATLREIDADAHRAQAANLVGAEDVHVD